jgi:DNA repair protein RadC
MTALAVRLATHREPTLRVLRVAVSLDPLRLDALVTAGVPRWDADACLRRLREAGEVAADGTWSATARTSYQQLIADIAPGSRHLDRLNEADRPRERALAGDTAGLDDAELLALILRTGSGDEGVIEVAQRLLNECGGLLGLARLTPVELLDLKGLGEAKASELAAVVEISRRLHVGSLRERPQLTAPEMVAALCAPLLTALPHEEFWCLPLDARARLIGQPRVVGKGDVQGTDAPPRAFFQLALRADAVQAVAVHNHPTGDPSPSAADLAVTRALVAAGRAIGVPLQDHVIIGDGGRFVSLRRDQGSLFS